jgi:hypothetical protein
MQNVACTPAHEAAVQTLAVRPPCAEFGVHIGI